MNNMELIATAVVRDTEVINQKLRDLLLNPFAFDEAKKEEILQDLDKVIAQLQNLPITEKILEDADT